MKPDNDKLYKEKLIHETLELFMELDNETRQMKKDELRQVANASKKKFISKIGDKIISFSSNTV
jgi:hypothetical protein